MTLSIPRLGLITFQRSSDGEVVWALIIAQHDGKALGVYRAERINPPPYITPL